MSQDERPQATLEYHRRSKKPTKFEILLSERFKKKKGNICPTLKDFFWFLSEQQRFKKLILSESMFLKNHFENWKFDEINDPKDYLYITDFIVNISRRYFYSILFIH